MISIEGMNLNVDDWHGCPPVSMLFTLIFRVGALPPAAA
jgi:hypothetical protein